MNLEKELIGKGYPVKNADDNSIVGYKKIARAHDVQNRAAVVVFLEDSDSALIVSYKEAVDLVKENNQPNMSNVKNNG